MENDFGQLIVHLINKDKLPNFKTTRSFWCTRQEAFWKLVELEIDEGNIIDKRKVYFKNKHFKY